jgi:hypothetical protein
MKTTNVTGLTIQEIFITGRKPTLTVALTCSKFLAPAIICQFMTLTLERNVPMIAMDARYTVDESIY